MPAHRIAAAAVVVIAIVLSALTFGFEQMPEGITRGFGAELFPRLVLGTIIALAVVLALPAAAGEARLPRIAPMVYFSLGAMLAFMALIPVAGMLPTMFVFLIGLGRLWGERRYLLLLGCAALLTLAIWGVFVRGFGIQLPTGLL